MTTPASPIPLLRRSDIIDRPMDNTALDAYMRCPRLFKWSMLDGWQREGRNAALEYGSLWHRMLETWYKGGDRQMVFASGASIWLGDQPEEHRTFARACLEFDNYLEKWGEKERQRTVGFADGEPLVEIASEIDVGARHPYAFRIDRVVCENGLYYIEDHKTAGQVGDSYFRQFMLSNQMTGYAFVARELLRAREGSSLNLAGVRINLHATYKAKHGVFDREVIPFSKQRLDEWPRIYDSWLERIERDVTSGNFPPNLNACSHKYGMCQFADICVLSEAVREKALAVDYIRRTWDPMALSDDV